MAATASAFQARVKFGVCRPNPPASAAIDRGRPDWQRIGFAYRKSLQSARVARSYRDADQPRAARIAARGAARLLPAKPARPRAVAGFCGGTIRHLHANPASAIREV